MLFVLLATRRFQPYLTAMSSMQLKLVTIYYDRLMQQGTAGGAGVAGN